MKQNERIYQNLGILYPQPLTFFPSVEKEEGEWDCLYFSNNFFHGWVAL